VIILSIDSGLERTGYCVSEIINRKITLIEYDCIITSKKAEIPARCMVIFDQLKKIIDKYKVDKIVVEKIFFNTNQKTLISVAQAQGVTMLLSSQYKLDYEFLTPLQIKQILTGYGNADKKQVQKMVMMECNIDKIPKYDDTIDAIAVGLAYYHLHKGLI
jgi:crossover junction endodeoxyribonuclease RuvC